MSDKLITVTETFDYENVTVKCPYCEHINIYNRVTDLKITECIDRLIVSCYNCAKKFILDGDVINPAYQTMFFKAGLHFNNKEYMQTIITICTAYEMMFIFILQVFLTIKPLKNLDLCTQINEHKKLNKLLDKKIEQYTFINMLNLCMNLFIDLETNNIDSSEKSTEYIQNLNKNKPTIQKLNEIKNSDLRNQFLELYNLSDNKKSINFIRNKVAHKYGYRPTKKEAEHEIKTGRKIIFNLTYLLNLMTDDVITYYKIHSE